LFDGVGALLIMAVLAGGYRLPMARWRQPKSSQGRAMVSTKDNTDAQPNPERVLPAANVTRVSPFTLDEIMTAIRNAPPLQRSDVARRYEGMSVQWDMRLWNAHPGKDDQVRLTLDFGDQVGGLVWCEVILTQYRELGVMQKGAPITVVGRIKSAESAGAELHEVQLFFHASR
jgi:hypothetical protein